MGSATAQALPFAARGLPLTAHGLPLAARGLPSSVATVRHPAPSVAGPGLLLSLVGILLVAVVAARLLGVRRSVWANLASGVTGWIAGVVVSTLIARGEPNPSAGFTRNVWVFSAVFTMSMTVWVELLARPGTLARAQSSVAVVPHPLRSLQRRVARVRRYGQITSIAARAGLGPALGLSRAPASENLGQGGATAARVRKALEEAGGVFVKLGQVLSTRSDLLPPSACAQLARLQDAVREERPDEMRHVLEAGLGRPVTEVFAEFDWEPIATASIGQAYAARLTSGERVVVKVQRPGIAEAVRRDIDVLTELARLAEERTAWAREYRVRELAAEFADRLRDELDFTSEAANATAIASRTPVDGAIRVPRVHLDLTSPRVLVMEWLDGVSVRSCDHLTLEQRAKLADELLRSILAQVLTDGRFHADPHPGNVLVLDPDHLGLIDFGAVGRLDPLQQNALRDLLVAVARRDPDAMLAAVLAIGEVRHDVDDTALERALARFAARRLGPESTPSAAMLTELLQLSTSFGLAMPAELSTVFRALGTVEGTLRVLAPGYLAIDAAQRIAHEWAGERANAARLPDLVQDEVLRLLPLIRRMPTHLDRLATQAQRGQLHLQVDLLGGDREQLFLARLVNRGILGFLGGAVGLLSVLLLGIPGGPPFAGSTTLFQFFGYFGLFCSTVLILRVLIAVLNDRTA